MVKNPPAMVGHIRDVGWIPGLGRPPGGGRGSPLQDSCLKNPMDRGAWRATVHGVAQSRTRLKRLSVPVLRTWCFQRCGLGSIPAGRGNKILQAMWCGENN